MKCLFITNVILCTYLVTVQSQFHNYESILTPDHTGSVVKCCYNDTCDDIFELRIHPKGYSFKCIQDGEELLSVDYHSCWRTIQFSTRFNTLPNISSNMNDDSPNCLCDLIEDYDYGYINSNKENCELKRFKYQLIEVPFDSNQIDVNNLYHNHSKVRESLDFDNCHLTCKTLTKMISCTVCPYTIITTYNNKVILDNIKNTSELLILEMDNTYYEYILIEVKLNGEKESLILHYDELTYCKNLNFFQNLLISNWFCMDLFHKVLVIMNLTFIMSSIIVILIKVLSCFNCKLALNLEKRLLFKPKEFIELESNDKDSNTDDNNVNDQNNNPNCAIITNLDNNNELPNIKETDDLLIINDTDEFESMESKFIYSRKLIHSHINDLTRFDNDGIQCFPTINKSFYDDYKEYLNNDEINPEDIYIDDGNVRINTHKVIQENYHLVNYAKFMAMSFASLILPTDALISQGSSSSSLSIISKLFYILLGFTLMSFITKVKANDANQNDCQTFSPLTTNGYTCVDNICQFSTNVLLKLLNNNAYSCLEFNDDTNNVLYKFKIKVLNITHTYTPKFIYSTNDYDILPYSCSNYHPCAVSATCLPYSIRYLPNMYCNNRDICFGYWPEIESGYVWTDSIKKKCGKIVSDTCVTYYEQSDRLGYCTVPYAVYGDEEKQGDRMCSWRVSFTDSIYHVYELSNHQMEAYLDIVEILPGTSEHYQQLFSIKTGSIIKTKLSTIQFSISDLSDPINSNYKLIHNTNAAKNIFTLSQANDWNYLTNNNIIGTYQSRDRLNLYLNSTNSQQSVLFDWSNINYYQEGHSCIVNQVRPKFDDQNEIIPGNHKGFPIFYNSKIDKIILLESRLTTLNVQSQSEGVFFVKSLSSTNEVYEYNFSCISYEGSRLDFSYNYSCKSNTGRAMFKEVIGSSSRLIDYWTCDNKIHHVDSFLDYKRDYYIEDIKIVLDCKTQYFGNFTNYRHMLNSSDATSDSFFKGVYDTLSGNLGDSWKEKLMNICYSLLTIITTISVIVGIIFLSYKLIQWKCAKSQMKQN